MKNTTTMDADNVHNQPPTLNERIAAAKAYVRGLPSARNLTDDQLFIACRSALESMSDLVSVGDPSMRSKIEHWEREIVPCLAIDHWRRKYSDAIKIPILKRVTNLGTSEDVAEVTTSFWELMVKPWIKEGNAHSLISGKLLTEVNICDLAECACYPVCTCHDDGELDTAENLPGYLFRYARKVAESWRTKRRKRDQTEANERRDARHKAAQQGIVCVPPVKVDPSDVTWAVSNLETTDPYGAPDPDDVNDAGMPRRYKHAGEDEVIVSVKPTIKRQRAVTPKGNASDIGTIQQQRWAEACSTHKSYHFTDDDEGRAAQDDWRRLPHNGWKFTGTWEEWEVYVDQSLIVTMAPRQRTGEKTALYTYGDDKYVFHRDMGRVVFINRCSDGKTWVEVSKQRIQVETSDLSETKWVKTKQVITEAALAVA